jgi:hypothetical protein
MANQKFIISEADKKIALQYIYQCYATPNVDRQC